ncbi:MAG TPA: restriction endonuclease [Candidatus Fimivivens faecavium]|nr:restriction endonuclease [Candidatus Fimivivens faecavium]
MKKGYLSEYFTGVAAKVLSAVEADTAASNQHEYNGVAPLKKMFGTAKRTFSAQFIYLNDGDDEPVTDNGTLTWYDAREAHPTRTEYRMYFTTTAVSVCAAAGDELFIGLRPDDTVLVVIAECGSTICSQLRWLFGVEESTHFSVREELDTEQDRLAFASRFILEQLGIKVEESEESFLEEMILRFGNVFPSTREFSEYARSTLPDLHAGDNPDVVLMKWIEREEILFRTFEKYLISERLAQGFENDVDGFFRFSLSAQNRRKSRAGQALENHVEQLFICRNIRYDRTKVTENNARPDFIFPSIETYHDEQFSTELLTMLGVKSTCKDRWRQVLSEADRISEKHLLTFEAAISVNQTHEMEYNHLQLVVPEAIHRTYTDTQQKWLMNVADFLEMLLFRQRAVTWH